MMQFATVQAADQLELARLAKGGDQAALSALVTAQAGVIRKLALSFARQHRGVAVDDLFQDGCLAVLDAVCRFDPERGYQFTTYATTAIRRRMGRHVATRKNRPISPQEADGLTDWPDKSAVGTGESCADRWQNMASGIGLADNERRAVELRHGLGGVSELLDRDGLLGFEHVGRLLGMSRLDAWRLYREAKAKLEKAFGPAADDDDDEEQDAAELCQPSLPWMD